MKKKRWLFIFLALVAGYFLVNEFKGYAIDYYADNYYVRITSHPATAEPDQICLTWTGDPRTTQAVQWRTSTKIEDGWVEYRRAGTGTSASAKEAEYVDTEDRLLENNPVIRRFTAEISGLDPGIRYAYRVGSREQDAWSEWREFITAPASPEPFSFIYLGDAQIGFSSWKRLLHQAHSSHPHTRFYVIAGDLVNKGNWRNEWDDFFASATGVFDRRPVIPVLGNHDYAKQEVPLHYLHSFALPENGPENLTGEHAYSLTYGNVLFVMLDSNLDAADQSAWLKETLVNSDATWKLAVYHHPAYSSAPHRDNEGVQNEWVPLFEEYGLDIALQGHDHAYLRTHPMRSGEPAESNGVYYTVTVSGTKYYEQEDHSYAAVAFPEVSTYQVIEIDTNPDRLTYTAYDTEQKVRDQFTIEK